MYLQLSFDNLDDYNNAFKNDEQSYIFSNKLGL